jgi:SAM-dependent methyltransferase
MLAYALTIFTGAFLLFQVQPLMGRYLLPWFGGSPGVWTTCMLFFQVALLAGYAYAHYSSRWLKPRTQAVVHGVLLLAALALLPIAPGADWKPVSSAEPIGRILLLLTACLGLPYFVLSTTGPLMQEWFRRMNPGVSPYRLYALSNVGSLLALISYPVYFEPSFTRQEQARLWGWGLICYALAGGYCAWRLYQTAPAGTEPVDERDGPPPTAGRKLFWLALPACASALLLATTNKLCQDVAVIPFLWVLPLAIYLLTFIICFDNPRWYSRVAFAALAIPVFAEACTILFKETNASLVRQLITYSAALFVGCMICHGELYRLKPAPRFLTSFFLMIAAGGALGGFSVAVLAPLCFDGFYEYHWSLWGCWLLLCLICLREKESLSELQWLVLASVLTLGLFYNLDSALGWIKSHYADKPNLMAPLAVVRWGMWLCLLTIVAFWVGTQRWRRVHLWRQISCAYLFVGLLALGAALWSQAAKGTEFAVAVSRNFYGTLTVFEHHKYKAESHYHLLQHGRITHGLQFADPLAATWATTYYGADSGVGLAINSLPPDAGRRIGLVGLGTGTLTRYGRKGDYLRIYDINPAVIKLAKTQFTYLKNCKAQVDVILGDARLSMENESPQKFDVLALDAFSSDAIPVHLLTREAIEIYLRHLKPDGIIAVHISNRYLKLEPVVDGLAQHFGLKAAVISNYPDEDDWWLYTSTWVLLARNPAVLANKAIQDACDLPKANPIRVPLWTDEYTSLLSILQ